MILPACWRVGVLVGAGLAVSTVAAAQQGGRPECPHDWDFKGGQLVELTPIRDIPEYHDCQRFIVQTESGGVRYDSLFAIFAVAGLEYIEDRLRGTSMCAACTARLEPEDGRPRAPSRGLRDSATSLAVVAARILAEGDYPPLGITRGDNCLYLFLSGETPGAIMVPVTDASTSCQDPINPGIPWGTELQVVPQRALELDTVPPVARWDWDGTHLVQYIGVFCGAHAWCEVGPAGFTSSPSPNFAPPVSSLLGARGRVKGWYDEQYLAFLNPEGRSRPSVLRGRIFPGPGLGAPARADVSGEWTDVAWIVVDTIEAPWPPEAVTPFALTAAPPGAGHPGPGRQYKERLNLDLRPDPSPPITRRDLNQLQLCHGSLDDCLVPTRDRAAVVNCTTDGQWWAKVIPARGGEVRILCVTRRGHENQLLRFNVPGTTRWRWMASDEGIWNACGQGCCETLGLGG